MDLIEKDPKAYARRYFDKEQGFTNKGMEFGKKMADGLESGDITGDETLDLMIEQIPKFEIMDKEFFAELKRSRGQEPIIILAKPDTMKKDMTAFKEYKTSQTRWSQRRVDNCTQIQFYATAMWLKTGKIPKDVELVEIATKASLDGEIAPTGDIYRYKAVITMVQVLNMIIRMKKAWAAIEELTEARFV